jgi:hypothetical protein
MVEENRIMRVLPLTDTVISFLLRLEQNCHITHCKLFDVQCSSFAWYIL